MAPSPLLRGAPGPIAGPPKPAPVFPLASGGRFAAAALPEGAPGPHIEYFGRRYSPDVQVMTGDGELEPLADVLEADGALMTPFGGAVRARTGHPVGSALDQVVRVRAKDSLGRVGVHTLRTGTMFKSLAGHDYYLNDLLTTDDERRFDPRLRHLVGAEQMPPRREVPDIRKGSNDDYLLDWDVHADRPFDYGHKVGFRQSVRDGRYRVGLGQPPVRIPPPLPRRRPRSGR